MSRRSFLGAAFAGALAASASSSRHSSVCASHVHPLVRTASGGSVLDHSAAACPIDTVVVVMMENRSFDHYFGWLADDAAYLEEGRRRHGETFRVDGRVQQRYRDPSGQMIATRPADFYPREKVETRGCSFRIPGHNWVASRVQRDHGFLGTGTGNDEYALTYFAAEDMRIYAALARRFTVFDQWHASLLGPTFPNRQYFLSATSEGMKTNPQLRKHPQPIANGIFHAETILERLAAAEVSVGYYYTNLPLLALWGPDRMAPYIRSLDRYFDDAATGTLPQVVFVEPQFGGGDTDRTDDHPRGDIGMGQRWVREVFRAFVGSPHWQRGVFILAYDEHGGFFDHVRPPHFADARASRVDVNDFGQGGFRVPALLASPYARRGAVDHRRYDHTSIMRFLEWRFLGAPAEGTVGSRRWALSARDRGARNMAATLLPSNPDPDLRFDLDVALPPVAPACTAAQLTTHAPDLDPDPFAYPTLGELAAARYPAATYRPWLADTGL